MKTDEFTPGPQAPEHRTVSEGANAYGSYTFDSALAEIERLGQVCEQHLQRAEAADARLSAQPSAVQEVEAMKAEIISIDEKWFSERGAPMGREIAALIDARLARLRQGAHAMTKAEQAQLLEQRAERERVIARSITDGLPDFELAEALEAGAAALRAEGAQGSEVRCPACYSKEACPSHVCEHPNRRLPPPEAR